MIPVEPQDADPPTHEGGQFLAKFDGKCELSIREFRYALTFFLSDAEKSVSLLSQLREVAGLRLRKPFCLTAWI